MPATESRGCDGHGVVDRRDPQAKQPDRGSCRFQFSSSLGHDQRLGKSGRWNRQVVGGKRGEFLLGTSVEAIAWIEKGDKDARVEENQRHSERRRARSPGFQTPVRLPETCRMAATRAAAGELPRERTIRSPSVSTLSSSPGRSFNSSTTCSGRVTWRLVDRRVKPRRLVGFTGLRTSQA